MENTVLYFDRQPKLIVRESYEIVYAYLKKNKTHIEFTEMEGKKSLGKICINKHSVVKFKRYNDSF